jgi:hypothetical protein
VSPYAPANQVFAARTRSFIPTPPFHEHERNALACTALKVFFDIHAEEGTVHIIHHAKNPIAKAARDTP